MRRYCLCRLEIPRDTQSHDDVRDRLTMLDSASSGACVSHCFDLLTLSRRHPQRSTVDMSLKHLAKSICRTKDNTQRVMLVWRPRICLSMQDQLIDIDSRRVSAHGMPRQLSRRCAPPLHVRMEPLVVTLQGLTGRA
jgi:hypothetical protein